jgi:hypothetical protein
MWNVAREEHAQEGARLSRSQPRTLIDAGPSANRRPSQGGRPIQHAAKIRTEGGQEMMSRLTKTMT